MKQIPSKKELIKFIEKEIDYDSWEIYCLHCGKPKGKRDRIYHKNELASRITNFLGFRSGVWDDRGTPEGLIFAIIDDFVEITGNKKEDAKELADRIWNTFWEDESEENNERKEK